MSTATVRLEASSLWSKWGFMDGDILGEFDLPDEWPFDFDPLPYVVEAYLVPAIKAAGHNVSVEKWETCHNPMRVCDWSYGIDAPEWADAIFVDVSLDDVLKAVEDA